MRDAIYNYGYIDSLSIAEIIATPIYLIIIIFWAYFHKQSKLKEYPHYKYFLTGLILKIIGALGFCYVYINVYHGGDTVNYFESAKAFSNLFFENNQDFFSNYFSPASPENYYKFSPTTGYPWQYMYYEAKTLLVIKIATPIVILSFNSFILATFLFSVLSYFGIWKAYEVFISYYPTYHKTLFYSFIAVPSVIFWGSGILKDTITLSATCWFVYFFNAIFIKKKYSIKMIIYLSISAITILFIKSYILIALMPGVIFWLLYGKINKIKIGFIRLLAFPFILTTSVALGFSILSLIGDFNLKKLLEEASVKQNDLKQAYYQGSSFDIGNYEPTPSGALTVAPSALYASFYRPTFLDARNAQMILSALENFILLGLTVIVLIKNRVIGAFSLLFKNPLILFCFSYSLILAILIGLSTSNFGALIRFKIAFAPFLTSTLVLLYILTKNKKAI